MHTVPVTRNIFLSALVALALFAGGLFASTQKASASLSECTLHEVCIWSESNYKGKFAHTKGEEPGCYTLVNANPFKSGWNRSNHNVTFGTAGLIVPGEEFSTNGSAFSGEICIK